MAGEKYIVAAVENPLQIAVRNILNPEGYFFLGNCSDAVSLIRLIRSYQPDFIVVDLGMQLRELRNVLETLEDEMLCACILIGDYSDGDVMDLMEKSKVLSFCPKPLNREVFIQVAAMANMNYKRVYELSKKLKEMTDNYETRKLVERAKWILMERNSLNENEAYEKMRKKSMDSRMSMRSIAEAIIFTHEITNK
ncbi:response regulator receiver and ANTAR domain protein [Anaerobacterium chartisolvens]|uniref:Stage 0 sporulation protein A homolog n=1 Tax=Anaerobacterium chartisolvens TaxID=1297424 RepID=A0A369BBL7_9FIRM|nr:ANTAR domain-containing protein [Anaerobacterium chartisolvens]RCX17956.1 response regulator receiver and ANTAR domain protein [Anaerobacterium chartisolvens]